MLISLKSEYNYQNSLCKIEESIEKLKEKVNFLAIADDNSLIGSIKFIQKCKKNNIIPIVGIEIRTNEFIGVKSVLIYACNTQGLENLNSWISSQNHGKNYKRNSSANSNMNSVIDDNVNSVTPTSINIKEFIQNNKKEEIIIVFKDLVHKKIEQNIKQIIENMEAENKQYYFANSANVEINLENIEQNLTDEQNKSFSNKIIDVEIPMYVNQEDLKAYIILQSMKKKTKYLKEKLNVNEYQDLSLEKIMAKKSEKYEKNTKLFVKKIQNYEIKNNYEKTLDFSDFKKKKFEEILKKKLKIYLEEKQKDMVLSSEKISDYNKRIDLEIKVIKNLNFQNYFWIVQDIIEYLKSKEILYGEGRGSAPGSLVSFLLEITTVDPIEYGLYFERFLNPIRSSIPDIDLDIQDNKRNEVIEYLINKYSDENVGKILTINTYLCKSLISEVGKSLEIPDKVLKKISENVVSSISFEENIKNNYSFFNLYLKDPKFQFMREVIEKLEGIPKNSSIHAAGIIISSKKISSIAPINDNVIQCEAKYLEENGFVKFDLLALTTLSFIKNLENKINEIEEKKINLNKIPLSDEKTFRELGLGKTFGVFQMESRGINELILKYKPKSIMDIGIIISLYRPGPMQNIDLFLKNKNGTNEVEYIHPKLKTILKDTHGIIIFQEQIMDIAKEITGFTNQEADIFRVAVSKKKIEEIQKQKKIFLEKGQKNQIDMNVLENLYYNIEAFANYGFNKAHAVAYAKLIYKIMYLKTNYSNVFYSELFHKSINSSKKEIFLNECAHYGLKIYAPEIIKSNKEIRISGKNILLGFNQIKGINKDKVEKLIKIRKSFSKTNKKIKLNEFFKNVTFKINFSEEELRNMIYAGAYRSFKINMKSLITTVEKLSEIRIDVLFATGEDINIIQVEDYSFEEKNKFEEKALGFNIEYPESKKILENFKKINSKAEINKLESNLDIVPIGKKLFIWLKINTMKKIRTKNNEKMCFIECSVSSHKIEVICFPQIYKKYEDFFQSDNKERLTIMLVKKNQQNKIICEEIYF